MPTGRVKKPRTEAGTLTKSGNKRYPSKYKYYVRKPGQPPIIGSPEELDRKIQKYIKDYSLGVDKHGDPLPPPTIAGLARYCGFTSVKSLYDYEYKKEYSEIVKMGRLFVTEVYEQRMHGNNATGAIFALKNIGGWRDTTEVTSRNLNVNVDVKPSEATLEGFKEFMTRTTRADG